MISVLWVMLFVSSLCSGTHVTKDEDMKTNAAASVVNAPILSCANKCEIRFEDGECKVDIACLMRFLFVKEIPAASSFSVLHREGAEEDKEEEKGSDGPQSKGKCKGKCLFRDEENNCRLDLICLLDRDVEGTLRFLVDLNVDAETAILLALSAESGSKVPGNCGGSPNEEYIRVARRVRCSGSCDDRNSEGSCIKDEDCKIDEEEKRSIPGTEERVVIAPLKPCPGKCEVRDPRSGNCVVDYNCASGSA
ncbi:uncharacterized protein [Palaemon carinicauda]|uniref:uncharacterized protein n=1 Tax=Palaemon carinicauda TaxID=392227 RepID=UPI0035B6A81F